MRTLIRNSKLRSFAAIVTFLGTSAVLPVTNVWAETFNTAVGSISPLTEVSVDTSNEAGSAQSVAAILSLDSSALQDPTVSNSGTSERDVKTDYNNLDPQIECMAKVVRHEAANQSMEGQLAVAQIIVNRVKSGRFAPSICGVVHQRGQFFDTTRYNPNRSDKQWRNAVDAATLAMAGTDDVTSGAHFYHAAYAAPTSFFRSRQRVATIGDHLFYR